MEAKCPIRSCLWTEEVPHMDAATEAAREHYRGVHPTRVFRVNQFQDEAETWNRTADDWLELCVPRGQAEPNYGYLREYLEGYGPDGRYDMPDVVRAELQGLYDVYLAARQQPQNPVAARPGNVFIDQILPGEAVVEENPQDAAGAEVWAAPPAVPPPFPAGRGVRPPRRYGRR